MQENPAWSLPRRDKMYTLAGAMLGLLLASLDQTVVATAGPAIQRDFHVPPALYAWITTAYIVANVVMVPVWGKLSDIVGRKQVILTGIGVFLAGSFLCGLAWNTWSLIGFRFVQGLGAASLFTSAFSVIADLFPPRERAKFGALISATFGVSSVLGPVLGGAITDALSWHWVFFINLPVGAVAITLIVTKMPVLRRDGPKGSIDWAGVALLMVAVIPLLVALSFGRTIVLPGQPGMLWTSPVILGLFGLAFVGCVAFWRTEMRVADPIVDFRMYRERTFGVVNLVSFILGTSFLAGPTFVPLFLVNVRSVSATAAGVAMLPLTFGIVIGSALGGQLAARVTHTRRLIAASQMLLSASFAVFALVLTPETPVRWISTMLFFVGLGMGPTLPLLTLAVQNAVPIHRIGMATAGVTFARGLGQAVGLGVLGSVFAATVGAALAPAPGSEPGDAGAIVLDAAGRAAVTLGLTKLYTIGAVVTALSVVATMYLPATMARRPGGAPTPEPVPDAAAA
jgi:EmrB/QacA subfamily drug resistance transporter